MYVCPEYFPTPAQPTTPHSSSTSKLPQQMNETDQLIQQLKNLQIQQAQAIARLEALNKSSDDTQRTFNKGDRVRIKNRIKASIFTKMLTEDGDRMATVTRTRIDKNGKIDKVFILTDNGLATYRLPKNLERITK